MPGSSTRENGVLNKKNKGKEKSRVNGPRDPSPADKSNEDLQNVTKHLKRLTRVAVVLNEIMPEEKLDAAERAFQPQMERENEIERLNNVIKALREEREHERASLDEKDQELRMIQEEFEGEMKKQRSEKEAAESHKKEYGKEMLNKQERAFNKEKANLELRKDREISRIQGDLEKVEKSNELLKKEKSGISEELKNIKQQLKSEKMAREGLEMKISKLEIDQEKLKSDVAVASNPTEFYTRRFGELSYTIQKVVKAHFTALPKRLEDKYEDLKSALQGLGKLSVIFKYTPATSDAISDFLRLCAVEHAITTKICTFINKRFIDGCSPQLDGGASLLGTIQRELSKHSKRSEDIWTALTMKALEPHMEKDSLKERKVQEILKELGEISDPQYSQQLKSDVESIVDAALELWIALRSDNCRPELSFEPELCDKAMWFALETPSPEIGQEDTGGGQWAILNSTEKPPSLALFPRVVIFHDKDESSNSKGSNTKNEGIKGEIVHIGRALFSDSDAFNRGIKHQKGLERLYHDQISGFHAKKKSLSSPVTDKGFSFQFPVQKS